MPRASAKGLAHIKVENGEWKSPIVSDAEPCRKMGIEEGDLILFAADEWLNACEILGKIRPTSGKTFRDRQDDHPNRSVQFPLGGRLSILMFKEMNRWYSITRSLTWGVPKLATQPSADSTRDIVVNGERTRRWLHSLQPRRADDLRGCTADSARRGAGTIQLHARGVSPAPHGGIGLASRLIAMLATPRASAK